MSRIRATTGTIYINEIPDGYRQWEFQCDGFLEQHFEATTKPSDEVTTICVRLERRQIDSGLLGVTWESSETRRFEIVVNFVNHVVFRSTGIASGLSKAHATEILNEVVAIVGTWESRPSGTLHFTYGAIDHMADEDFHRWPTRVILEIFRQGKAEYSEAEMTDLVKRELNEWTEWKKSRKT